MGQVYRARDSKLDRDVAIKILPEAFADDVDRLARLQREAKTLAALRWSRDSREIYYRGAQHIISVRLDTSNAEPAFGKLAPLFADDYEFGGGASIANYDVTPDGRFIMIGRGANGGKRIVVNWQEELKQILASGGLR
jgi:serine/threonine protein kinase